MVIVGALAVGIVVGSGGRPARTAGAPPARHPQPTAPVQPAMTGPPAALEAVACPDASNCVAVGGPGGVQVSRSGGRTWSPVTAPTRHFLSGVSCSGVARCVAVGDAGTALVTEDGGTNWTVAETGTDVPLSSVSCLPSGRCYAVGDAETVLVTDDDGHRWHRVSTGSGVLNGVACSGTTRCAAVTSSAVEDLASTDGRTWTPVAVPFSPLDALAPLNGIACAGPTCLGVGGHGLLSWSSDGGTAWSPGQTDTTVDLDAVACPSPARCVAVGQSGTILSTGGPGSEATTDVAPTMESLLGVACPTTDECVAVGSGGTVLTSDDGGATWSVRAGEPVPAAATRVLVVGDSFAHTLAMGLARNASAYGVTLIDGSLDGCALARGGPVLVGSHPLPVTGPCGSTGPGWPAQYRADVAGDRPTLSLLVLGPWDLSTRLIDGQWSSPGQPAYDAYFRQQVASALQILTAAGGRVAMTTVPVVRTSGIERCVPPPAAVTACPSESERVAALDTAAEQATTPFAGLVTVIGLGRRLAPAGTFAGQVDGVVVRAADGVHLSMPGGEWLTPWLIPQLVAATR